LIGKGAQTGPIGQSNFIVLGNSSHTTLQIPGIQSGASNGDVLTFNSSAGKLELQTPSAGGATSLNGLSDVSVDLTNDSAYFINIPAGLSGATGNLVIGETAANSMVGSDKNVILGFEAFKDNVNGLGSNVIIGYQAAYLQTSGQATNAVAIGYGAAGGMGNPYNSVSIGYEAGRSCTNGYEVVFVGRDAGRNSNTNYQVFVGTRAGQNSTAQYGIALGHQAGQSSTGNNSIAIGNEAGKVNTASGTISIGYYAGLSNTCLLYTSPSPRDVEESRMPSSA